MKQFTKRRQSKMHLNQFLFTLWEQKDTVFQSLTIKSISETRRTKYSLQPELKLEIKNKKPYEKSQGSGVKRLYHYIRLTIAWPKKHSAARSVCAN